VTTQSFDIGKPELKSVTFRQRLGIGRLCSQGRRSGSRRGDEGRRDAFAMVSWSPPRRKQRPHLRFLHPGITITWSPTRCAWAAPAPGQNRDTEPVRRPTLAYTPPVGWIEAIESSDSGKESRKGRFHTRDTCESIEHHGRLRSVDKPYSAARCSRCADWLDTPDLRPGQETS
jgi:hypothetical protein